MSEIFDYIKNSLIMDESPADEVLVIDGIICIRVNGELLAVKVGPINISITDPEKKPAKKKPVKKKTQKGKGEKAQAPKKNLSP